MVDFFCESLIACEECYPVEDSPYPLPRNA